MAQADPKYWCRPGHRLKDWLETEIKHIELWFGFWYLVLLSCICEDSVLHCCDSHPQGASEITLLWINVSQRRISAVWKVGNDVRPQLQYMYHLQCSHYNTFTHLSHSGSHSTWLQNHQEQVQRLLSKDTLTCRPQVTHQVTCSTSRATAPIRSTVWPSIKAVHLWNCCTGKFSFSTDI